MSHGRSKCTPTETQDTATHDAAAHEAAAHNAAHTSAPGIPLPVRARMSEQEWKAMAQASRAYVRRIDRARLGLPPEPDA